MAPKAQGTTLERLLERLVDPASADPLHDELADWLARSARFRDFASANADKIRKKLRTATDVESRRDVRAELRAAHLLLADRRMDLAFEAYGAGKAGPDFTVTFRGERTFNLEVTRLRRPPTVAGVGRPLLAKLHQLPPSVPNVLVVAVEGTDAAALDVAATTRELRARADSKDEAFFVERGFDGSRGFYERYLRLGGVVTWCEAGTGEGQAALWTSRSARIPLSERAMRACVACLQAG